MGYGDDILATGLARGLAAQGKLAAFGDRRRILWGPWSEEMFRHNPNIARPEHTGKPNLQWIPHYKGKRMYNTHDNGRWKWNYDFKVRPGEFYFDQKEQTLAASFLNDFVVIEPNVPWHKRVATNKDWGEENYDKVAHKLQSSGVKLIQFLHKNSKRRVPGATLLEYPNFRDAIAVLSKARLYIGPEGGMHHAAAATGVGAVVIMGGFIPPSVVGYDSHVNLTGGVEACGNIEPCIHCRNAMKKIDPDVVVFTVMKLLEQGANHAKTA